VQEGSQFSTWSTRQFGEVIHTDCPARQVLDHVTSRWGVWVLIALREQESRFFQLREQIEGISEKMLSQTLRTLVRDGLVWRAVEPSTPPKVSYGLTPLGQGVSESLGTLFYRIRDHAEDIVTRQAEFDEIID
jgi:DNA-binding HxlR family transcriptional regulator